MRSAPSTSIMRAGIGSLWSCGIAGTGTTGASSTSNPVKKARQAARCWLRHSPNAMMSRAEPVMTRAKRATALSPSSNDAASPRRPS